jgi:hypothetical protein
MCINITPSSLILSGLQSSKTLMAAFERLANKNNIGYFENNLIRKATKKKLFLRSFIVIVTLSLGLTSLFMGVAYKVMQASWNASGIIIFAGAYV